MPEREELLLEEERRRFEAEASAAEKAKRAAEEAALAAGRVGRRAVFRAVVTGKKWLRRARHNLRSKAQKAEFDATVALAQKKLGRNIKKRYGNGSANVRRLLEVFGD